MAITKHPKTGIWQIDIKVVGYQRIRCSSQTTNRQDAQELHDKLKMEAWKRAKLGERPSATFDEVALEMLKTSQGSKDYQTKVRHVIYWRTRFGGRDIRSLTSQEIMSALPTHSAFEDKRANRKLSNATVNRFLATIKRIMSIAHQRDWIDKVPHLQMREEAKVRVRFLTKEQARGLIAAVNHDWLRDLIVFALGTGMRQGEIFSLRWSNVNLDKRMCWIEGADAKSGHARAVPLNDEAYDLLVSLRGKHSEFVFTRNDKPLIYFDDEMFKSACRRAEIENFRFHDLRHTWASWHVQNSTPLLQLQALGGWKTLDMVLRYAHLSTDHLSAHVNAVSFKTSPPPLLKVVA